MSKISVETVLIKSGTGEFIQAAPGVNERITMWESPLGLASFYLVVVNDRHTDPAYYLFDSLDAAIARARQEAQENARHPDSIEEEQIEDTEFFLRYSVEGDYVAVVKLALSPSA